MKETSILDQTNMALAFKEEGNNAFKQQNFIAARDFYSKAIMQLSQIPEDDQMSLLLCNRAAAHMKLLDYSTCISDCDRAIKITPAALKAYYRRAQAQLAVGALSAASVDTQMLLRIDPSNAEAISLMRIVKAAIIAKSGSSSEIQNILLQLKEGKKVQDCLKALISLCAEEQSQAADFMRKGGNVCVGELIAECVHEDYIPPIQGDAHSDVTHKHENNLKNTKNNSTGSSSISKKDLAEESLLELAVRVIAAAANHETYVTQSISFEHTQNTILNNSPSKKTVNDTDLLSSNGMFKFNSLCSLLSNKSSGTRLAALSLLMRILKSLPLSSTPLSLPSDEGSAEEKCKALLEMLKPTECPGVNSPKVPIEKVPPPEPYLKEHSARAFLSALLCAINVMKISDGKNAKENVPQEDIYCSALDALSAFVSESPDYFGKIIPESTDIRLESLEYRKARQQRARLLKNRAKAHARWAVEEGILSSLIRRLEDSNSITRQQTAVCLARVISAYDGDEELKKHLHSFFSQSLSRVERVQDSRVVELADDEDEDEDQFEEVPGGERGAHSVFSHPPIASCKKRAALTAALFTASSDLGVWALELEGGVPQLLVLVATGDLGCQELSSEVMCQAASCDKGSALLAPIISLKALTPLMSAPSHSIRSAAAATMSKLGIKAKAFENDSNEISVILNTVLSVLKAAAAGPTGDSSVERAKPISSTSGGSLVSFSTMDEVGVAINKKITGAGLGSGSGGTLSSQSLQDASSMSSQSASLSTSTERAIEVLAGLVGRTHVKEEIVHGSYRVAASVSLLLSLGLDLPTHCLTASYGLAHILSALTITNMELKTKALAEKGMTTEQYNKLMDMQRIKAKDGEEDEVNPMIERKEEEDPDTLEMCERRIREITGKGGIPLLAKLLTHSSPQTVGAAARALKQICVVESSRGVMVQQGGLKACCTAAMLEANPKDVRRDAAHAVAKTLVSINPHSLTEHLRLGAMLPLIALCRDIDATCLQQYECCLSLGNLVSHGPTEQDKLAGENGVSVIFTLVCSDHRQVRRSATEVFCNMATHEAVLKMLRSDKIKVWLAICEDGLSLSQELASENTEAEEEADPVDADDAESREEIVQAYGTSRAAAGVLAMSTSDEAVCVAVLECSNFVRCIMALLQSLQPELVHRALIIVLNMLSVEAEEARQEAAVGLCEASLLPVMGVIIQELKGEGDAIDQIGMLAMQTVEKVSAIISKTEADKGTEKGTGTEKGRELRAA